MCIAAAAAAAAAMLPGPACTGGPTYWCAAPQNAARCFSGYNLTTYTITLTVDSSCPLALRGIKGSRRTSVNVTIPQLCSLNQTSLRACTQYGVGPGTAPNRGPPAQVAFYGLAVRGLGLIVESFSAAGLIVHTIVDSSIEWPAPMLHVCNCCCSDQPN